MNFQPLRKLLIAAAAVPALCTGQAFAGEDAGDGAPHIAIAQEESGELVIEFEVALGLDESTTPPTINLVAPIFDPFFDGFQTVPLTDTGLLNSDLGFVSEVEGQEEGGAISGDIVVRLLSRDDNFAAFFDGVEIFTESNPDFVLGNQFDTHPTWTVITPENVLATATASFEVFDVTDGAIGSGAASLGSFNIAVTAVPEPTSAFALLAGAGLLAARRRRR